MEVEILEEFYPTTRSRVKQEKVKYFCKACNYTETTYKYKSKQYKKRCPNCIKAIKVKEKPRVKLTGIYILVNKAWPDWCKIGLSEDIYKRLNSFQTNAPLRDYNIPYYISIDSIDLYNIESKIHLKLRSLAFRNNAEWFNITALELYKLLEIDYKIEESKWNL